ncbi:MAG: permease [Gammaproteobacteria bacterium]|nr:permease [Gammaproteobacteria bacterium]|tara:strand:+ start:457 stop:951 length:495 start_codon:yes stop_codon:yes gene_type:complete
MRTTEQFDDRSMKWLVPFRWLAIVMVGLTLSVVLLRYLFSSSTIFLQELITYAHALFFLLGIPLGILRDDHVRVDLVYSRLSERKQSIVNLLGHILFLLPLSALMLFWSTPYAISSWQIFEGSNEVGGVPAIFLLKSLLPITALLIALIGLSKSYQLLKTLRQS